MDGTIEGTQLEGWARLSGLTGLTLRNITENHHYHHHRTLATVLPLLTALQSLVLDDDTSPGMLSDAAGGCISAKGIATCPCLEFQ
jgi:hypothetical protein